jgi:DNA-binding beta-propeller fold protein YncE
MTLRWLSPCCLAVAAAGCSVEVESTVAPDTSTAAVQIPTSSNPYTLFETLQVRPLAMSPNGKLLFALNTPDNRLEIYRIDSSRLTSIGSVVVGLEPTAVAARTDDEVWVTNHLSDSVSIVKVGLGVNARVTRTLLVGDEPRDIVFAGPGKSRAFITCAHRGQNTGDAYDLQTAGVGRADVWVFDANNLGTSLGGSRLTKLTFFADTPRALAVSADGSKVYAAAFKSGNQTTAVSKEAVELVYGGVMPGPATITLGGMVIPMPPTGLIVKFKDGHWVDAYGTNFDAYVKVKLPDYDVFAINANANPPVQVGAPFAHVGTVLFNMAVNPVSGKVYVTNLDARNDVRFEGHTPGFTSVRGHIADNRITVIDPASGAVTARDLNSHIDHEAEPNPAAKELAVAFPQDVVVSKDGSTLYTVAQGSGKLAIYSTAALEAGDPTPTLTSQVPLSGGGPTGVVVDEARHKAYVLTRFDNSISIVDLRTRAEVNKTGMYNPEPASVTVGRQYLYDTDFTSGHGDSACASCHIGGDNDDLAWDLGDPGGRPLPITKLGNVQSIAPEVIIALLPRFAPIFNYFMPLKGPMTTQSLRGMDNHGAMHWRGDRNGAVQQTGAPFIDPATGTAVVSAQPNTGFFDEHKAFTSFNVAFPGLIGRGEQLSEQDMSDFADFMLQVVYPPNPIRNLDNSLTPEQQIGRSFYFNSVTLPDGTVRELPSDRFHNCNGCHTLDPTANMGVTPRHGFFGTDGRMSFEFETQIFKVPHLRNMYTKIGMFGSSPDSLQPGTIILQQGPATDQIRGYGFQHDGSLGTMEHFFTAQVFLKAPTPVTLSDGTVVPPNPFGIPFIDPNTINNPGGPVLLEDGGFALRKALVAFMIVFDTNLAPAVGQQITLTKASAAAVNPRIDLLVARATAGECDLVAKAATGWSPDIGYYLTAGQFKPNLSFLPSLTDLSLRALVNAGFYPSITYTCVPTGSGARIGIDRDNDGYVDGDELLWGTNPTNPDSHP